MIEVWVVIAAVGLLVGFALLTAIGVHLLSDDK